METILQGYVNSPSYQDMRIFSIKVQQIQISIRDKRNKSDTITVQNYIFLLAIDGNECNIKKKTTTNG